MRCGGLARYRSERQARGWPVRRGASPASREEIGREPEDCRDSAPERDRTQKPIGEKLPSAANRLVPGQGDPHSRSNAMGELDLAKSDSEKEGRRGDARPEGGPKPVEPQHCRRGEGDPEVKAHERRAPGEHAYPDGQADFAWRRSLTSGAIPQGSEDAEPAAHCRRRLAPATWLG
jgi:hypothetical protein